MFRYVAFVWDDADQRARAGACALAQRLLGAAGSAAGLSEASGASKRWQRVLVQSGLEVWCADVRPGASDAYLLDDNGGVVLGKLFATGTDGTSVGAPFTLRGQEAKRIVTSAGRRLIERYWGRYVAFLHDAHRGSTFVMRDPTGALPCFAARSLGIDVYFSRMEEGALLADRAFSINWTYVAATLCHTRVQSHATGLNEVTQVLGGECLETRGGATTRQFYWNPLRIAEAEVIDNAVEAARSLRERTRDCVHAWASSYPSLVHLLSGGLDSSIVLACLKDAASRPRITCLNFHSPGSNTDERDYARLAAAGSGCEVVERPRNADVTLKSLPRIQKSCIPTDYFFYLDGGRTEAQVAADHAATAVFSGYGGDQLFYQARARFAAGDYLCGRGIGPALFAVALDAARVDRISVWSVLRSALSQGLLRRRWSLQSESGHYPTLVRREIVRDISGDSTLLHPWFHAPGRAPSGKIWHAFQLLFPLDFYNPLGSEADPEPVTPLLSQPLLELVMRIPTWLLTIGGWDRALARRAFQHDVPRAIVTRRTKGGQEEHAKSILTRDIGFARELLLDGHLVREGIVSRARVGEALSGRPSRSGVGNTDVYACLSAEAWLRQWQPV